MTEALSRRLVLGAALATTTATPAMAQKPAAAATPWRLAPQRIEQTLQRMVADGRAAGVSAVVWQAGSERYFGAFGQADREAKRPMARDTVVRIWSMTKPVASVALMRLWDEGRFRLDDPLATYLPEFKSMRVLGEDGERAAQRPILVRDILRHTAGLTYGGPDSPAERAFDAANPFVKARDLADFSRIVASLPLRHEPGTAWQYGTSTDIVARLVEVLAGEPFDAHVRRHVLLPLGMKETDFTVPAARKGRFAATYQYAAGSPPKREPDLPDTFATGGAGLIGSIDDYLRFARMLLGEGALDGTRVLRPTTVRLMLTDHLDPAMKERQFLGDPGVFGFGLGGSVRVGPPVPGGAPGAVGEYSWGGMASTVFWVDPANQLAVVFFAQKLPFDIELHKDLRRAVYG